MKRSARKWLPVTIVLLLGIAPRAGDAQGWQPCGDLPGAEVVLDLLEASDGTIYAATYPYARVFVSTNGGLDWTLAAPLDGEIMAYALAELPDSSVAVGTFPSGDLFVTTDRGASWTHLPGPPPALATELNSLLLASNGVLYAGCAPEGFLMGSSDGGQDWFVAGHFAEAIVAWTLVEGPPGTLWAGTTRGTGIFRTTDWGLSWEQLTDFRSGSEVYDTPSIASILPGADGVHFAGMVMRGHGSTGGIFRSTDDGATWELVFEAHPLNGVWALLRTSWGEIWAGLATRQEDLVYRSPDGGETWLSTGPLPEAREVFALIETSQGFILAGTAPNGDVFRHAVPGAAPEAGNPSALRLRLWPNPAAGSVTVALETPAPGRVVLDLLDPSGRRIQRLLSTSSGGREVLRWSPGEDLSAGLYIVRLRYGDQVRTRKLVLLP
jgi:photosystem II stability/assembly factor-like uncharacterized protein